MAGKPGRGAVGIGTARALEERGIHAVIAPAGEADSEALAALPELQDLQGRSIVIFRGRAAANGCERDSKRGARESSTPSATAARGPTPTQDRYSPAGKAAGSKRSRPPAPKAWRISSTCWPDRQWILARDPVFVPHPRIALAARKLDVREIVVTGRGDDRTVAEMAAFFAKV